MRGRDENSRLARETREGQSLEEEEEFRIFLHRQFIIERERYASPKFERSRVCVLGLAGVFHQNAGWNLDTLQFSKFFFSQKF